MAESRNILARVGGFVKAEPVFSVALIAALLSMIAVPPSLEYFGYIKWRTLGLLTMFMLCVAGLQKAGVLERIAQGLVESVAKSKGGGLKALVAVLVLLPYAGGMFITNDVALLTFVPFALMVLLGHRRADLVPLVLTLQTIAANAGSYLTPFGNPHNLYSYTLFNVGFGEFIAAQAPFTLLLGVYLAVCIALFVRNSRGTHDAEKPQVDSAPMPVVRLDAALFAALFAVSVLSVLKVVPVQAAFAVVVLVALLRDRALLAKVDWLLLGTFVCFFIFSSNLAAIPAVSDVLTSAMSQHPFWITMGASQVISNVPSCTLLAPFTTDWRALAVGANLGGLGSPVGSLASLITLGFFRRSGQGNIGSFMKVFLGFNVAALALTCGLWVLLG
ncbi:MAG: SLC13 family permease [Eggerthellales bacterium]|nr:SLC13 family permease [Eggerthellales bacterium]